MSKVIGFSALAAVMALFPFTYSSCVMAAVQDCGGGGGDGDPICPPAEGGAQPVCSPIILDLSGHGFHLTDARHGVRFDITGDAHPVQIAWTVEGTENAFLALDRNGNGVIDDGTELFGNFTPQPPSAHRNGFAALAVYDKPQNGGNGDGVLDARDQIFSSLRLWIDANHDGICQPEELFTLPAKGVDSISLNYRMSMRRDQFGNLFRYRARVNPDDPRGTEEEVGRVAYDVFLTSAQ